MRFSFNNLMNILYKVNCTIKIIRIEIGGEL